MSYSHREKSSWRRAFRCAGCGDLRGSIPSLPPEHGVCPECGVEEWERLVIRITWFVTRHWFRRDRYTLESYVVLGEEDSPVTPDLPVVA